MKVKQSPDDFRVEELTDVRAGNQGEFAFYRLTKVGWTTVDALQALRRRWKLDHSRVSYGGLKDRHAHTIQYVSIFRGPRQNLRHSTVEVEYLGQIDRRYTSTDIRANRFGLVLRDLTDSDIRHAEQALDSIRRVGVPNYFDDQRFGSVGYDREFVTKRMVLGEYEAALKIALASANPHDRAPAKREKQILLAHWGDWPACKAALPRSHARSLVDYLIPHPTDFRGALQRLRPELRGLYVSAYQSYLWNQMLVHWLRTAVLPEGLIDISLRLGPVPMPVSIPDPLIPIWESLSLPLPSARLKFDPAAPWAEALRQTLHEEGFALEQIKLRGFRKPFFSKGDRPAMIRPTNVESRSEADEWHAARRKLSLNFELRRGSYATMIIKRLDSPV